MRILLTSCCLAAGCGFGSPSAPPGDGPTTDTPMMDGPADAAIDAAPTCLDRWRDGSIAFGNPTHLATLGASGPDRDPFVSPDELTIYFSSDRGGTQSTDIFAATRTMISEAFPAPAKQNSINSADPDTRISLSGDGLTAVLASSRAGTEGNSDLWIATRANTGAQFTSFVQTGMTEVNTPDNELDPELSSDGQHLYLAIGNPQRIAMSAWNAGMSRFDAPQQLNELFSNAGDADPSLSPDELVIVYSSRSGSNNADLHYATRATRTAAFGAAAAVPTVNSAMDEDGDPALSADGCRLYFASDRSGDYELYVAQATP